VIRLAWLTDRYDWLAVILGLVFVVGLGFWILKDSGKGGG
jgi:hypothetical protein